MKIFYITLLLLMTSTLFANELEWVDKQIAAIKPTRTSISSSVISRIHNPFVFLMKKKVTKGSDKNNDKNSTKSTLSHPYTDQKLHLKAILNKSAFINNKWYKEHEKVYSYNLITVSNTFIILQRKNKKIVLSTKSESKHLKFYNK